jgi:hypothetical protein
MTRQQNRVSGRVRHLANGVLVAGCLALAGCATSPVSDSEAELVPTPGFGPTASADSEIIITRDSGLSGAAGTAHVLVDGREAVKLARSQQARLHVAAGDHVIAVANIMGDVQTSVETVAKPERARHFRVAVSAGGFALLPQ